MATVSSMSRYILDSYYKSAASGNSNYTNNTSSDKAASETLKNSSSDKYNTKNNKYSKSDSYAALIAMGGMNKNNLAKKTVDTANSLANSSLELVAASNYRTSPRGGDNVNSGLVSKVKKFVESYNNTVNTVKNSDNVNALRYGVSMVDTTKAFKKSLAKVGITIEDNNNLTIDEEKLNNAKTSDLSKLFSGSYSYGSRMVSRSLGMSFAAKSDITGTYNAGGSLNSYTNSVFNTIFNGMA